MAASCGLMFFVQWCRWLVPVAHYQTVCSIDLALDSGCSPRAFTVGLRQHHFGWPSTSLPVVNRLQSVLDAAAWSIGCVQSSYHITCTLASFHCMATSTRANKIQAGGHVWCPTIYLVSAWPRSSTSDHLDVCLSHLFTVGDRAFATTALRLWNSLGSDVQSASSLTILRRQPSAQVFQQCYLTVYFVVTTICGE